MTSSHIRTPGWIVVLDIDGVLCLGPYSGWDAREAVRNPQSWQAGSPDLWQRLFHPAARANLAALHEKVAPAYVLSTSWRTVFTRREIGVVLERGGLGFVARNLHRRWRTPIARRSHISGPSFGARGLEIGAWIQHFGIGERLIVIDDEESGPYREQLPGIAVVHCDPLRGFDTSKLEQTQLMLREISPMKSPMSADKPVVRCACGWLYIASPTAELSKCFRCGAPAKNMAIVDPADVPRLATLVEIAMPGTTK